MNINELLEQIEQLLIRVQLLEQRVKELEDEE